MKKSTNRLLFIILIILLAVYIISRFFGNDQSRSFDPLLYKIDTAKVDKIQLDPKGDQPFELIRTDTGWIVQNASFQGPAQSSTVNGVLGPLANMEANRIVAKGADRFSEYEVAPDNTTSVQVYAGGKKIADFYVGKFSFNQQKRTAHTYIRPADSETVYLVEGFLGPTFNTNVNSFRNHQITSFAPDQVQEINFYNAGKRFNVIDKATFWQKGEQELDTSAVQTFLESISNLSGRRFAESVRYEQLSNPVASLEIRGQTMQDPVRMEAYQVDTSTSFLLYSTQNPRNLFLSDSSGVYKKLFMPDFASGE